jgi:hypothetical protein
MTKVRLFETLSRLNQEMRHRRAYRELVATPWGFNVYRAVDELHLCMRQMVWDQEVGHQPKAYNWSAVAKIVDKRAGDCRLSRAFLNRLEEQIKRAELVERARLSE